MDAWKMGMLLLFFGLGLCMQPSSSSSEVPIGNSDSDSKQVPINNFCIFENFVASTYLEKYESLLESKFQDCVTDEISSLEKILLDYMKHHLRLSVSQRHLIGEGSHRQLSSTIGVHIQPESSPELPEHFCTVILVERLPSGVFADPFELQHLHQRGGNEISFPAILLKYSAIIILLATHDLYQSIAVFSDAAVLGDTNLELPSFRSNRTIVEIHMNAGPNILLSSKNQLEIKVDLPLHARYQPLDDSGYKEVEFGPPDLFMHCNVQGKPSNRSWFFMPTIDVNDSPGNAVIWRIPSGIRAHATIVSAVTFLAAFSSTLIIVAASIFYSDAKFFKNLKQS